MRKIGNIAFTIHNYFFELSGYRVIEISSYRDIEGVFNGDQGEAFGRGGMAGKGAVMGGKDSGEA